MIIQKRQFLLFIMSVKVKKYPHSMEFHLMTQSLVKFRMWNGKRKTIYSPLLVKSSFKCFTDQKHKFTPHVFKLISILQVQAHIEFIVKVISHWRK